MSGDTIFVFVLLGVASVLMATNRIRFDIIALSVVLALMLSGVSSIGEALSGFGDPVVILVAGLLVVGEMLDRTGVAAAMGDLILKTGGTSEIRLMIVIMAGAAVLGAVMSSTAVVAIFIPIVLRVSADTTIGASKILLPMSYAALISGMLTLIATPPNLVVSEELKNAGYAGFGFASFSPVGLSVLIVAILYVLAVGRRLLPRQPPESEGAAKGRSIRDLWDRFGIEHHYHSAKIWPDSPLAHQSLADADIERRYLVSIVGILRKRGWGQKRIALPAPDARLEPGDVLLVGSQAGDFEQLAAEQSLSPVAASPRDRQQWLWELGAATALIHPESALIGKSVRDADFRARYGLHVLGLRRDGQPVAAYRDMKLAAMDSLFLAGPWPGIQLMQSLHHDFVVMETPAEKADLVPGYRRMPLALFILGAMVVVSILNVVPLVAAVVMAAMAAVLTGCLTMEDAYRSVHWSSLVLVAGMLPLADALQRTGGTQWIVDALISGVGEAGPRTMLTILFFLTAATGLFLSNTASAVLVAPIAIIAAEALGVSPYPFAVAVLIAASAAFSTPFSTPVVTLVVEPGRYGFMDFVKVGVPLLALTYVVTVVLAPVLFPF